jgi:hypothetical protein
VVVKIAFVGFLSALLGAFAGGVAVYLLFERWGERVPIEAGSIQVTELTLVDAQRRPAARLGLNSDGFVALEFLQLDSQKTVELKASRNGGYESLQFGPFNGGPGQMFLATDPYGTSLYLGDSYRGPRLTLGAIDPGDTPPDGPASSWGVFFGTADKSFKQPDPHYPRWVRNKPHARP